MADMIFEPVMIEPLHMKFKCGRAFKLLANKELEMVQISTDHLPGV